LFTERGITDVDGTNTVKGKPTFCPEKGGTE